MQFKTTFIMAFIFLVLGLYVFYIDIPESNKKKIEEKAAKKIIYFEKDTLSEFTLFLDKEIVMRRDKKGGWLMVKPVNAKGDKRESEGVVSRLNSVTLSRVVDKSDDNLETYGLLKDPLKIGLKIKGEEKFIYIGFKTPLGNGVYVKRGWDNLVFLAGKYIKDDLIKKTVYDLRDKTVFDFNKKDLLNVNISNHNELEIIKVNEGYRVSNVSNEKGDEYEVNALLNKIKDLKIKKFVYEKEGGESSYFFSSARSVSVTLKGKIERKLLIGEENNGFYYSKFKNESDIFMLSKGEIDIIFAARFFNLRDKSIFNVNKPDISKIKITFLNEIVTLKKGNMKNIGNEWEMISPVSTKANEVHVETLISSLLKLELISIYDGGNAGTDQPFLGIVLYEQDDTVLGTLDVLSLDGNKNGISKSLSFKDTFIIKKDDVEKLSMTSFELKDRRLLSFKDDNVKEVSLKRFDKLTGSYFEIKIEKTDKSWKAFLPEKISVDEMKIRPLLWGLSEMEYEEGFINDDIKTGENGLLNPNLSITVSLENGSDLKVHIGNELPKKGLVVVKTSDNIYLVKKQLIESLYLKTGILLKDLK